MMASVYVAKESTWVGDVFIREGTLVSEDDDVYRKFPGLFKPAESQMKRPDVEQATQAPGEHRAVQIK